MTVRKQNLKLVLCCLTIFLLLVGCGGEKQIISSISTGDQEYEQQKIFVEDEAGEAKELTVAELRLLPQMEVKDCSLQLSTGEWEHFQAAGPKVSDALSLLGLRIEDYEGLGFIGRDGYYCLVTPEILAKRDMFLALNIDGEKKLTEEMGPMRLCLPEEFGPYWVRMLEKIILYEEIPQKDITSVWMFDNLTAGIEPYPYEYYGSKDDAIELVQIFSRFDNVNSKAFFTINSADGFLKNEAISTVAKDYYIKISGDGAPMNITPKLRLGMNVKNIAWFSTNADAVIFPKQMAELRTETEINGSKGVTLEEILEETRVLNLEARQYELIGVDGESVRISGQDLAKGIVVTNQDGKNPVVWQPGTDFEPVNNLLRVRVVTE